jgi:hypothetical protein
MSHPKEDDIIHCCTIGHEKLLYMKEHSLLDVRNGWTSSCKKEKSFEKKGSSISK